MAISSVFVSDAEDEASQMDDNGRVDCGHYEYWSLVMPTPGGALLCRSCTAKLLLLKNSPTVRADRRSSLAHFVVALKNLCRSGAPWLFHSN